MINQNAARMAKIEMVKNDELENCRLNQARLFFTHDFGLSFDDPKSKTETSCSPCTGLLQAVVP